MVSGQCLGDQRSCLIELKDNLKFNSISSTELMRWNESFDCCLQKGLGCSDEHVIGHKLTKESIFGLAHSSSLFGFQNQSLANNKFCSCQFDMLTNLSYLYLSNSGFAGHISIEISRLKRLVILDLSTDSLMSWSSRKIENPNLATLVQNVSEFKQLYVDGVKVSPQRNECSQALSTSQPNLKELSMLLFHFSGHLNSSMLIPSFSISKYLTQSNLSHNQLTNDQISTSTHWEKQKLLLNLVKLDLGYDSLVGSIVSLFSLLSLQKLRFSNNRLLSQLDTLYLSSNIFEERIIMLCSWNPSSSNETRSTEIPILGSFGGQPSVIPAWEFTSSQVKTLEETPPTSGLVIDWNLIIPELGFIFGLGIIYWPLILLKRWRIWYFKHVDDLLFWMFQKLYLGKKYRRQRRAHKKMGRMH